MKSKKSRKIRFGRYFFRLWANSIFLVALPILVLGYVSYGIAAGLLQEKIGDLYLQSLQHAAEKLDQRLRGIETGLYHTSESIYVQLLQRSRTPFTPGELLDVETFIEELSRYKRSDEFILEAFAYFSESDTIVDTIMKYEVEEYFSRRISFTDYRLDNYRALFNKTSLMNYILAGPLDYSDRIGYSDGLRHIGEQSVVLLRSLPFGVTPPTTVCGVVLNLQAIETNLYQEGLLTGIDICIVRDDGIPILQTGTIWDVDDDLPGHILKRIGGTPTGSVSFESDGRTFAVLHAGLTEADWTLVAMVELSIITREALRLRHLALGVSLLVLIVGALVAYLAARRLYRPVNRIISAIQRRQPTVVSLYQQRLDELGVISEQLLAADAVREKYRTAMQQYLPMVRERFFYHLAKGNYQSTSRIRQQLDELEISMDAGIIFACCLEIDHFLAMMDSEKHIRRQYLFVMITDYVVGKLREVFTNSFIFYDEHRIGIIVHCESAESGAVLERLINIFQEIQRLVEEERHLTLSVGIGDPRNAVESFPEAYEEAVEAVGMKFFHGLNQVITHRDYDSLNQNLHTMSTEDQEHIENYILNGSIEAAADYIDTCVADKIKTSVSPQMIRDFYSHVLWLVSDTLDAACDRNPHVKVLNADKIRRLNVFETLEETKQYVTGLFDFLAATSRDTLERYDGRIKKIVDFLNSHYDANLTLTFVAEEFGLSSAYLSSLFKKTTGKTFTDYLMALRIEHAKERIRVDTSLKISAIASEVGFGSYKSFSRAFKHYVGLSPGDFRRQVV